VPRAVLELLACPACAERPGVVWDAARQLLACPQCGRGYRVEEGIVLMTLDDAVPPPSTVAGDRG
jgi:uncharacterized protein